MGKGNIKKTEIRGQIVRSLGMAFRGDENEKAGICLLSCLYHRLAVSQPSVLGSTVK